MREPYKRNKRILKEIEGALALLGGVWSLVRIQSPRLVKKRFRSHLERFSSLNEGYIFRDYSALLCTKT